MTVDEFVAKWNGKALDFDGAYGNQCWDLAAQYSKEVVGLQGGAWQVMPTGPNGGAIEVFTVFKAPLGTYYDKIANSPDPNNLPKKGDLVIWNWGTFGHIALCLGATSASISVFEQNSPVGSLCHITNAKQWSGCVGWIRPKQVTGGQEVFNTIEEVKEAYLQMRGVVGTDAEMRGWLGQSKQRWIQMSKVETDGLRAERDAYRNQLASVQQALANEQAKPPKEVVKEVQVIVEKPVEVIKEVKIEVPVPYDENEVVKGFFKRKWESFLKTFWGKG